MFRGAVWILFLNSDGTVDSTQKISDTEGGFEGLLNDEDRFGNSLALLGDIDGDEVQDIAVGAYGDDDGGDTVTSNRGAVWILFLNNDGTVKSHKKISDTEGEFTGVLMEKASLGAGLGSIGDLNGDGCEDLIVGACDQSVGNNRGAVWILFLNSDGSVKTHKKICQGEGGFTRDLDNNDYFGMSVVSLGDLDGNTISDVAIGAPWDDDGGTDLGAVWTLFLDPGCTQLFVNPGGNEEPPYCSIENGATTIAAALDASGPGDTVNVMAGSYAEVVEIDSSRGDLKIIGWAGAESTRIVLPDLRIEGAVVAFENADENTHFSGFRVSEGVEGIRCDGGSPLITNCILDSNDVGIHFAGGSSSQLCNCTIVGNRVFGVHNDFSYPEVRNTIIAENEIGVFCAAMDMSLAYNDVWGNASMDWCGVCDDPSGESGNISEDPLLICGFYPSVDSPCIDGGDTTLVDPDGSRSDIGVTGGPYAVGNSPQGLRDLVVVAEDSIATIRWASQGDAQSYVIYRDTAFTFIPSSERHYKETTDSILADTLSPGARFAYTVRPVDGCGRGGSSPLAQTVERTPTANGTLTPYHSWSKRFEGYLPGGDFLASGTGLELDSSGLIAIAGLPAEAEIDAAVLYWIGEPGLSIDGRQLGSVMTGEDGGRTGYRADVTPLFRGDDSYAIESRGSVEGAGLVVVYSDSTEEDSSSIVLLDGMQVPTAADPVTFTYEHIGAADNLHLGYLLGGGNAASGYDSYYLNGMSVGFGDADGSDGGAWDTDTYTLPYPYGSPPAPVIGSAAVSTAGGESLGWVAFVLSGEGSCTTVEGPATEIPRRYALDAPRPNPFNPLTTLRFALPRSGHVRLTIHDVSGRRIATLANGDFAAGTFEKSWDGTSDSREGVASGIYFARLSAGDFKETRKMVLLK